MIKFTFLNVSWIILLGVALLIVIALINRLRARKKVKEAMLYGGIEGLINALKDPSAQEEAIEALGETKDPRAVKALIAFINSPEVRREEDYYTLPLALDALSEIEDPQVVDFLIASLSDVDEFVRYYVCLPLASLAQKGMKDFRAVEPLIAVLKDMKKNKPSRHYDFDCEEAAEEALKAITGGNWGADPEKWEKWWEEKRTK